MEDCRVVVNMMRYSSGLSGEWEIDKLVTETRKHGTLNDHRKAYSWRHLDWLQLKCFVHRRTSTDNPGSESHGERLQKIRKPQICDPLFLW